MYRIGEAARRVGVAFRAATVGAAGPGSAGTHRRPLSALLRRGRRAPARRPPHARGRTAECPGHPAAARDPRCPHADRQLDGRLLRRLRPTRDGLRPQPSARALDLLPFGTRARLSGASVAALQRLTAAYETTLHAALRFNGGRPWASRSARRAWVMALADGAARIEQLARDARQLEPQLFVLSPGATSDGAYSHEGEEFLYLLDGAVTVWIGDAETYHSTTRATPCNPHHPAASLAECRRRRDTTAMDQHATDVLTDWEACAPACRRSGRAIPIWWSSEARASGSRRPPVSATSITRAASGS